MATTSPSIKLIRASDGSGNASAATVQAIRSAGATTIQVDTVQGIPDNFYASMGTPHTFTDPVTGETITVISEATAVDFEGHVDGSNLEIDAIAAGYTDGGSAVGDIVIIRPTTPYANNVANVLDVSHNDDGTFKNDSISDQQMFTDSLDPVLRGSETVFDHVASGLVITGDAYGSTRAASITAGVVYIGGVRVPVSAVAARLFTASRDTYVDVGVDGVIDYNEVTNNNASPALAANHIRIGIVITGASNIANAASINQGQIDRVLPIASSVPYAVTDSLGNLICSRDPRRRVLGFRQQTATQNLNSTGPTDITVLSMPIIVPTGRKVKITAKLNPLSGGGATFAQTIIRESSTSLGIQAIWAGNGSNAFSAIADVILEPSAGLHTYKASAAFGTTSNAAYADTNGFNAFIKAELL